MIEFDILYLFCYNRYIFNNYNKYINIKYIKNNYKELYKLYNIINIYYNKYKEADSISALDLEAFYLINYPVLKDVERSLLRETIKEIFNRTPNESMIISYLEDHKRKCLIGDLALLAVDVSEGRKPFEELEALYNQIGIVKEQIIDETPFVTDDLNELYQKAVVTQGLRWRLECLNKSLGSLRQGDFGFVFARPETGKTTFLADQCTFMAGQASTPILWFNNEEQGQKVMLRCYQASLGVTLGELFEDIDLNKQRYFENTKGNIKIFDSSDIHIKQIESICSDLNPSLVILDQIDKVKGFKEDMHVRELQSLYQWARELSKKYCPVIAVCQAGGTGEGKKWLTMDDVDSSKTAKQGEADWILGIGTGGSSGNDFTRYFNISKNKLVGDEDSIPELRHGKHLVVLQPDIARYMEVT